MQQFLRQPEYFGELTCSCAARHLTVSTPAHCTSLSLPHGTKSAEKPPVFEPEPAPALEFAPEDRVLALPAAAAAASALAPRAWRQAAVVGRHLVVELLHLLTSEASESGAGAGCLAGAFLAFLGGPLLAAPSLSQPEAESRAVAVLGVRRRPRALGALSARRRARRAERELAVRHLLRRVRRRHLVELLLRRSHELAAVDLRDRLACVLLRRRLPLLVVVGPRVEEDADVEGLLLLRPLDAGVALGLVPERVDDDLGTIDPARTRSQPAPPSRAPNAAESRSTRCAAGPPPPSPPPRTCS